MATIGVEYITYSDLAKRMMSEGNKKIGAVIDLMSKDSAILNDIPMIECNNGTAHVTPQRVTLPTGTWRDINKGVQSSYSETIQVTDKCAQLAHSFKVDRDLVNINNNKAEFLASEEAAHLEGMSQEMAATVFNGDFSESDSMFLGIRPRYNDFKKRLFGEQILDGRPATDTSTDAKYSSIYLINWSPMSIHGIFPVGLDYGFKRDAFENDKLYDRDGNPFIGYEFFYHWNMGIAVRDPRHVVRIANISQELLAGLIETGANESAQQRLARLMFAAKAKIPTQRYGGRMFWYMNQDIMTALGILAIDKPNNMLNMSNYQGQDVVTYLGIPVRQEDNLTFNEMPVVAA